MNYFHPLAYVSRNISHKMGNVVLSNSTIHSNVVIGDYNIITSNVTVEHGTFIGNGNFLAAGSCVDSDVKNRESLFYWAEYSSVRENVTLGNNLFAGMHSLVLSDFTACLIAGVPAVKMKKIIEN